MTIVWFPLMLICAFSQATGDALTKRALATRHNEYLLAWLRLGLTLPVTLGFLLFIPIPPLGREFYLSALTALPLEAVALILYIKALKISPLSLTVPFLALTPLFLLVVPYLLLGETISPAGGAGIFLIVAGSYLLNLRSRKEGVFAPFRAILHERGSLYMVAVAFIYSITSTLGKMAIAASSPLFFAAFYFPLLFILLTPIALWKGRGELRPLLCNGGVPAVFPPALCNVVEIITYVFAVSLANVAYTISVKRLSLFFGVLYGHYLFREEGIRERAMGGVLMVAGVALIVTGGR